MAVFTPADIISRIKWRSYIIPDRFEEATREKAIANEYDTRVETARMSAGHKDVPA